uniref:Uncharacterized protein n=1 Tax=Cannabis sativa TaxID=3483 RepID=A0A803QZG2_CANSA
MVFVSIALVAGAAVMSQNVQSWDLKNLRSVWFPMKFWFYFSREVQLVSEDPHHYERVQHRP